MGGLNLSSCPPKCASLSITLNLEAVCRVGLEEQSYLLDGTVASTKKACRWKDVGREKKMQKLHVMIKIGGKYKLITKW